MRAPYLRLWTISRWRIGTSNDLDLRKNPVIIWHVWQIDLGRLAITIPVRPL